MKSKLSGLIAAPCAPMHADGSINVDVVPAYAEHLRRAGVAGVFVNGTTGESLSLSPQERVQLAEAWAKVCGPDLKLIVHVGDNALPVSRDLAAHATQIGAAAIGAMPPSFFKPAAGAVADWCAAVADAAPEMPFYYYHIPSMTGVSVRMVDLFPLAGRIPSFAGAKYTFEDLMDYQMAVEAEGGRFDVLFGRDEMLLSGLAVGATGAVGSTYNYMAPVYLRVMEAFAKCDYPAARRWQTRSHQLVQVLQHSVNGVACGKAILNLCGVNVGPCRVPLPQYTQTRMEALHESLKLIGFFDWKDGQDD
ncbi:MAG: dihydrodipicolinate synthase family protein [Kiritimatiellae bacterium]|nr:dihydrodipicolinate synthase family protein [Kiritimatiellia bacterium]NLE43014.1 dihydrodipicolinate synthetase [Lentisphaerota bacterium]